LNLLGVLAQRSSCQSLIIITHLALWLFLDQRLTLVLVRNYPTFWDLDSWSKMAKLIYVANCIPVDSETSVIIIIWVGLFGFVKISFFNDNFTSLLSRSRWFLQVNSSWLYSVVLSTSWFHLIYLFLSIKIVINQVMK
jgi:hypothetical protein